MSALLVLVKPAVSGKGIHIHHFSEVEYSPGGLYHGNRGISPEDIFIPCGVLLII
jgi:hypothetical protein